MKFLGRHFALTPLPDADRIERLICRGHVLSALTREAPAGTEPSQLEFAPPFRVAFFS
jgi:hypothetical protein